MDVGIPPRVQEALEGRLSAERLNDAETEIFLRNLGEAVELYPSAAAIAWAAAGRAKNLAMGLDTDRVDAAMRCEIAAEKLTDREAEEFLAELDMGIKARPGEDVPENVADICS